MNKNGVRSYLQVRMPTFFLSDDEIRKLVLFFEAMSSQAAAVHSGKACAAHCRRKRALARDLFTNPAAPCLKCHATGDPTHDKNATAPNFLSAGDSFAAGMGRSVGYRSGEDYSRARRCLRGLFQREWRSVGLRGHGSRLSLATTRATRRLDGALPDGDYSGGAEALAGTARQNLRARALAPVEVLLQVVVELKRPASPLEKHYNGTRISEEVTI